MIDKMIWIMENNRESIHEREYRLDWTDKGNVKMRES